MRIGLKTGSGVALGVALAALGAGALGSPWGAGVRADARAGTTGEPPSRTAPPVPTASRHQPASAPTPTGSASDVARAAVNTAVQRLVAGMPPDSVSIAGTDAATGVSVGWGAHTLMPAASVFKLTLVESYLLSNQQQGRPPGDGISDDLTAMIENSDNDAADRVYAALGGDDGVSSWMRRLGLSATVLGPHEQWGLSTTSAADQSTLLTNLVSPRSPLSADSRGYAEGLMRNVEADQRWGVGAAADPGADFANKNGWLDVDDDGGRWVVSSVGLVEVGGHQIRLAVLTQHDADLTSGIHLVEALSRTVATALRSGTAASGSAH
jgi:hypothetical protein